MINKILNYCPVINREMIAQQEDAGGASDASSGSESVNVLLNQPEANALKSGHCMKDDCTICKALDSVRESQSSVVLPVSAKDCREIEKESNISLGICRICHCNPETLPEMGPLLSVCNCRGTVALVHMSCLERWLAESDSSFCELCRCQFSVQRIPKHGAFESIFIWASEVADFNQVQKDILCFITTFPPIITLLRITLITIVQLAFHCMYATELRSRACAGINCFLLLCVKLIQFNLKFKLLMDTVWFWLMTPLAAMAGYIFVRAASEMLEDNFPTDAPWLMGALLVNSCLTLVAYYGWVMTSIRRHISSWYHWWRTVDCIIKVQLPAGEQSKSKREMNEFEMTEDTSPSSQT